MFASAVLPALLFACRAPHGPANGSMSSDGSDGSDASTADTPTSPDDTASVPPACRGLAPVGPAAGPVVTLPRTDGIPEQRLPCYRASGDPACALRTYQVMVEAFVDGDAARGYGVGYGTSHHGGDLAGITAALPYVAELGMNALWLTPIFDSDTDPSGDLRQRRLDATGYFARDYFAIDPNFGTLEDARVLVDTARGEGIAVLFDGVFGHHKGGVTPSPQGNVPTEGNPVAYPASLPFYEEVAAYWVDELGIDGWRLDQAYQVPTWAWADLRQTVIEASEPSGRLGYMVAEVWLDAESITRTAYGTDPEPALASAFDFPLRYALVQTLAVDEGGFGHQPARHLDEQTHHRDLYPDHAMPNLMLGNHDLVRFGDLIQRGGLGGPEDPTYWARHRAALAFLAATSGPVTLYYGEETGDEVPGFAHRITDGCADLGLCDDHVARTSGRVEGVTGFVPDDDERSQIDWTRCLMAVRADTPALYDGGRLHLYSDDAVYADLKVGARDKVLFLLNVDPAPRQVAFAAGAVGDEAERLVDLLDGEVVVLDASARLSLPGLSARLLRVVGPHDDPSEAPGYDDALFLRGDFNGWAPVTPLEGGGGTWEAEVALAAGRRRFKLGDASPTFEAVNLGGGTVWLDTPKTLHRDSHSLDLVLDVVEPGMFRVTLDATDANAPVLHITAAP